VGKGPQMSGRWVRETTEEMVRHANKSISDVGKTLENNADKITRAIVAVDKKEKELVLIKLSNYN